MRISKAIFRHETLGDQQRRVCSKKSVQQGHSHFCARSVLVLREHGKMARTRLAAFFNRPIVSSANQASFNPTTPEMMRRIETMRIVVSASPKNITPTAKVPAAPIPVHTA